MEQSIGKNMTFSGHWIRLRSHAWAKLHYLVVLQLSTLTTTRQTHVLAQSTLFNQMRHQPHPSSLKYSRKAVSLYLKALLNALWLALSVIQGFFDLYIRQKYLQWLLLLWKKEQITRKLHTILWSMLLLRICNSYLRFFQKRYMIN